jgi:hypothetical protein
MHPRDGDVCLIICVPLLRSIVLQVEIKHAEPHAGRNAD